MQSYLQENVPLVNDLLAEMLANFSASYPDSTVLPYVSDLIPLLRRQCGGHKEWPNDTAVHGRTSTACLQT